MTPAPNAAGTIILDACCVINLYASGCMEAILASMLPAVVVTDYVMGREALYLFDGPPEDVRASRRRIELRPLVGAGLLSVAALAGDDEAELFVTLAASLDDGEARSAALAITRNWTLATDDLRAQAVLREIAPGVPALTTPDLMQVWSASAGVSPQVHEAAIRRVELRARFRVGKVSPALCLVGAIRRPIGDRPNFRASAAHSGKMLRADGQPNHE